MSEESQREKPEQREKCQTAWLRERETLILGRGHRGLSGNNKSGQRLTRKTDEQTKIAQREN
jgi:hypothetical protein